jgi:dynein light intermediate chain 1
MNTSANNNSSSTTNVWSAILEEVKSQDRGVASLPSDRNVIVLGDNESGKTTLMAKLQGVEDPRKGSGLEYSYVDVRDEYRDDEQTARLNVWILDGETQYRHLLKYTLTEHSLESTTVLLTVSMTKPWLILESLCNWAAVLQDHVDSLAVDAKTVRSLQRKLNKRWRQYVEPGDELEQQQQQSNHVAAEKSSQEVQHGHAEEEEEEEDGGESNQVSGDFIFFGILF